MTSMTFTGTLLEKLKHTPDSASFRFSRPSEYHFVAGQSYAITIPSPVGPLKHRFSHADSPTQPFTELTTRLTGSEFKNALDALPIGAEANFEGPAGRFLLRYDRPRVAFLVGGIGITPVRSILRYLVDTKGAGRVADQQIVLLYACNSEQGIVYREDLDESARALPGFRVVYVLSQPDDSWHGHRGHVDAALLERELGDPSNWTFYIVGPPPMVTAMDNVMETLSIPEAGIVKENFAGYTS